MHMNHLFLRASILTGNILEMATPLFTLLCVLKDTEFPNIFYKTLTSLCFAVLLKFK